ncbi:hypothetical protein [Halobacteriovorax sp. HLS]|uniref:hypothetical protein n=1 Tax=Halobacteriovorax sp. HLS TaxID=2234000 RepID=UPI000FD99EA1|nr:hypothetical protein [Halobacteriovorax sp. HLS]
MKIAISCDDLLIRDHYTEIVETVAMAYEDAEIYTLVHKEKAMLGTIELRKVHSSYLSHKIKDRESLCKNSFLIPNAATNLFIPCSVDIIINISNGMGQGIRKCKDTKLITYLYDFHYLNREKKSLREKLFGSYLKKWTLNSLCQSDEIWVTNEEMEKNVKSFFSGTVRVIEPPFRSEDYPLLPIKGEKLDYYAINAQDLQVETAIGISLFLDEYNLSYKFFGDDTHLASMKLNEEDPRFFGDRCSGELAPFLAHSKAVIDLSKRAFPEHALKGLSCGRPLICLNTPNYQSYLGTDGIMWVEGSSDSVIEAIKEMNNKYHTFDRKKLHGKTVKFHELKFKAEIKRRVHSFEENHSHKEDCC